MKTFFIATSNTGKQKEIEKFAALYGSDVTVTFPDETNAIDVDESGSTFEENALLKDQPSLSANADQKADYPGVVVGLSSSVPFFSS